MNAKFTKIVIVSIFLLTTIYIITKQNDFKHTEVVMKSIHDVETFFSYGNLEELLCKRIEKCKITENLPTWKDDCPKRGIVSMVIGGRTGNQMWNYAAIWAVARHTGLEGYTPNCSMAFLHSMFGNLSLPTFENIRNCPIASNQFVERPEEWNDFSINIILKVFNFQQRLVSKFISDIRREFTFKKILRDKAQNTLRVLVGKSSENRTFVGVHVRRTDYERFLKSKYKNSLVKPQFFLNAMEYFRKKYSNCIFIYISDDPKWCKKQFGKIKDVVVASSEKVPNSPAEDLATMAACNHTIFDYGTFGEWGSILAGGEIVCYNMTQNQNLSEIFLEWILMN